MVERAVLFTNQRFLENYNINSRYRRVYFGNEFCQKLIPTQKTLEEVLKYTQRKNLGFTFLTPFVTDAGLGTLDKLFLFLVNNLNSPEVVINDFGVLDLINEKYRQIQPILGRLVFRQKRDPRLINIIRGNQKTKTYTSSKGYKVIVLPKSIPSALKEAYSKSNVDFPEVKGFLLRKKIKRIEVDNLLHGVLLDLPKEISASIYVPFGYITVTRYCPMLTEKQKNQRITKCNKECQKYFYKLRASCMPKVIYKKGAAQFYKNDTFPVKKWEMMGIDRIVYEPELPI
jgi:hypothetical protein